MVYTYDEKSKKVKAVEVPSLKGSDAQRLIDAEVPKAFLESIMKMKLNIERT